MMQASPPIAKDLVLIGGGHSHAIVLKQFGMKPLPGVKLTLITNVAHTPYSGMLPGYVAGLYEYDDCHIDLRPLSQFAQARMIFDRAIGLDLQTNRVQLANHPPIAFDWLSIDIGSTPATSTVPGATDYATPVKPISQFLQQWDALVASVEAHPEGSLRLAIVGGGAGGVELALAAQARLQQVYQAAGQPVSQLEMHLIQSGDRLLPERHAWVGQRLQQIMERRGIQVHLPERVSQIAVNAADSPDSPTRIVYCESGLKLVCDRLFWVTQAAAADWLRASELATDERGFIQVNDRLQSLSHPQVFAAGDVATMVQHPRPKAGVFAVRQGQPLADNLRRALLGQPLQPFAPQKEFLILVGTGDRSAVASRGIFGLGPYPWLWQWKDWIDRQFMKKFSNLQPMSSGREKWAIGNRQQSKADERSDEMSSMHCAGCGSKVGSSVLERTLQRLRAEWPAVDRDDILVGLKTPDDAAVVQVPSGQVLIQTIDYFRALLDDPFLFGQISTNHCLSDIYAMGATPQSALAIATLPYALEAKQEELLYQLLAGAMKGLYPAGAALIGGHTTEASELSFGLSCNGLANPDHLWRKSGMQPGQVLILTKAIGTGTLFAADMQLKAKGRWIEGAIESMLRSNHAAAACLRHYSVAACTDVTGFGLLGHLLEMIQASQVAVTLNLDAIPILDGAKETAEQSLLSSLHPQNLKAARHIANLAQVEAASLFPLLFDPQTSGGLLVAVPAEQAIDCLNALKAAGYPESSAIGWVDGASSHSSITILIS